MPARNVYIALAVIIVSIFIALKTSMKEQVFRGVASQLEKTALYDAPPERLFEGALAGMTDALGDDYTTFIPPEEKNEYMREIQGQFAGVGLGHFIKDGESGEFYFVPLRGAPAAKAGLQFGDRIVEVDGKSVKEFSLFDLTSALRGDEKTVVRLKIRPRASICAFADATTPQTLAALETLEKAGVSSVILDFRGNPGGFLPDAVAICDEFVEAGAPIVEVRDRSGAVQEIYRATNRPKKPFRVVVLVDDESASASEIVSAALQDAGIAAVGGSRSYGKGTIQSLFDLPFNLGMLRVTTAQFFRPSGKPSRRVDGEDAWGVTPDAALAVELTPTQRFYRRWLRAVRASGPEAAVADPRIFAFATAETDALLRRAAQTSDAFARLEALAELGVDPETAVKSLKTEAPANSPNSEDSSSPETPFEPSGRAPYFDPQLDRAVDYLLGTLDAETPEKSQEAEKPEADATQDAQTTEEASQPEVDATQDAETPEETSNPEKPETDATQDAAE